MVNNKITVRQATPKDKRAIFDFIREAYPDRYQYKIPERWEWEFESNPFREPDSLPIWIAVDEKTGRIVGQSNALVERLWLDGRVYQLGWGVDFYVKPEYRGRGIGTRLQKANLEGNEIFMSLDMAKAAQHIKAKIGMKPLPPIPVYTRIIRHEPKSVLKTLVKRLAPDNASLQKGLAVIFKILLVPYILAGLLTLRENWQDWMALDKLDLSLAVPDVESFDASINALWRNVAPNFEALVLRDVTHLNWKFARQPLMEHTRFVARRENAILGYLVVRRSRVPERNAGTIVDLFAAPENENTIRTLLIHAIRYFRSEKVTYIRAANSAIEYQLMLQSLGFKKTREVVPMIYPPNAFSDKKWLLGMGDHDWDQYPLAKNGISNP